MLTVSKIKLKILIIKSIFTLSERKKERYYKIIEELAFTSVFEKDIFAALRDKGWTLEASMMLIFTIAEITKLIISR